MDGIIDRPSPNCDERALPVSMIVLHYTGMPDAQSALDRLTSPDARVSSHYLIDEDGTVYRLVDESKRAWHAGKSRWRGVTDVNSASVGIEIVNPGHEFGYREFPDEQNEQTRSKRIERSGVANLCAAWQKPLNTVHHSG